MTRAPCTGLPAASTSWPRSCSESPATTERADGVMTSRPTGAVLWAAALAATPTRAREERNRTMSASGVGNGWDGGGAPLGERPSCEHRCQFQLPLSRLDSWIADRLTTHDGVARHSSG